MFKLVENSMGQEVVHNGQFLLYPQCFFFLMTCTADIKPGLVWQRVNTKKINALAKGGFIHLCGMLYQTHHHIIVNL